MKRSQGETTSQVLSCSGLFFRWSSSRSPAWRRKSLCKIEIRERNVNLAPKGISAKAMKNGKGEVALKSDRSGSLTSPTQTPTKELFVMRIVLFTSFLLGSSAFYPAVAQDQAKPAGQSQTDNQTIGRDWKATPSDDQETVGNAAGKSPDSANHDDTRKVDRDWRVKPDSEDQKNRSTLPRGPTTP